MSARTGSCGGGGGGGWLVLQSCCAVGSQLAVITPQQETIQEEQWSQPATPVSPRQISHIRVVREPTVSPREIPEILD